MLGPAAQPGAANSNHVVIITLDGFGGWALDDPDLSVPTLRRLAARGAVAKGMRPVNPTVTWPNHLDSSPGSRRPSTACCSTAPRAAARAWRHGSSRGATRKRWSARDTVTTPRHERGLTTAQGGLGRDPERADDHLGVSRQRPDPKGSDCQGTGEGGRDLRRGSRGLLQPEHHVPRSDLDVRSGAHPPASTVPTCCYFTC